MSEAALISGEVAESDHVDPREVVEQLDRNGEHQVMEGSSGSAGTPSADAGTKHVVFTLNEIQYAVAIESVLELGRLPQMTRLPHASQWLRGVTNLHGEVLSVIDLRSLLRLPAADRSVSPRLIVVRSTCEDIAMGWIVDRIVGIRLISPQELSSRSMLSDQPAAIFVNAIFERKGQPVAVLNVNQILASPELRQFDAIPEED